MNAKTIAIVLGTLFVLSLVATGALTFVAVNNANSASMSQANVKQLMGQVTDLTGRNGALDEQVATLSTNLGNERQASAAKDATISDLKNQVASLQSENSSVSSELSSTRSQLQAMTCTDAPEFVPDYGSSGSMELALENFVSKITDGSRGGSYTFVWNNSTTADYTIMGLQSGKQYAYRFIGFFNEASLGHTEGVFWIDGECWLNAP